MTRCLNHAGLSPWEGTTKSTCTFVVNGFANILMAFHFSMVIVFPPKSTFLHYHFLQVIPLCSVHTHKVTTITALTHFILNDLALLHVYVVV